MIIFLHIPKTAGTSFNEILNNNYKVYPFGKVHDINKQELSNMKKHQCISGHISFAQLTQLKKKR
jgi:hypothetical protein